MSIEQLDFANLLTVAQAGRLLGIGADRVRQLTDTGKLPAMRTPYCRLIARDDVEALRIQREAQREAGRPRYAERL